MINHQIYIHNTHIIHYYIYSYAACMCVCICVVEHYFRPGFCVLSYPLIYIHTTVMVLCSTQTLQTPSRWC